MKWCLTEAQLAALRWEAEARAREYLAEASAQLTDRHDREIERVRIDHLAALDRLADPSAPFLAHLLELVAILRRDVVAERQRAEVAIDQCRATHLGIGPVTLPPRPEMTAAMPREFTDPELAAMGDPMGL